MMYKVVTEKIESLGLKKNPNIMTFPIGEWVKEPKPRMGKMDTGGIWCTRTLSNAKRLKKYYEEKYGIAKIYECEIARILYENSYRLKTDWVKLIKEIK